jgi:hypothetical protein
VNSKKLIPESAIRAISILCPKSGTSTAPDIFDGSPSGVYAPLVLPPSTIAITVNFSSAQWGSNVSVNAIPDTTGGWTAVFTPAQLPTSAVTDGVLVATKTVTTPGSPPTTTITPSAPSDNLAWTPPSREETHVVKLSITQPVTSDVVGRVFLAYGDYNPGQGHDHTVSLELFRETGDPALAAILPVVYPVSRKWVTAISVLESGLHYTLQATLRKKTGEAIISYPVGNITILG